MGPMDCPASLAGRGARPARISRQLRDAIVDGRLRPGDRLPPTREMAGRLAVSRNTVAAAYERLTAEGFLVGRVGAGTFVGTEPVGRTRPRAAPRGSVEPRRIWTTIPDAVSGEPALPYNFRVGTPDGRLFPLQAWRRLLGRELTPAALRPASYEDPAGHAGLRAAIARYFGVARSVRAAASDVVVTQGAQQALDLIGRVLVGPGSCVAVEEP